MSALLAFLLLASSVWSEPWINTAAWTPLTQTCFAPTGTGTVRAVCQSAALQSVQAWNQNQPITIEGTVRARPHASSTTDRYWGGIVLFQDDTHYGEMATQRRVQPFQNSGSTTIVSLSPQGQVEAAGAPWRWETFRIEYTPKGGSKASYRYIINGNTVGTVKKQRAGPVRAWVICVSAATEGSGNDGSNAECEFGPITVTGTPR